jgi:hypothetical protein
LAFNVFIKGTVGNNKSLTELILWQLENYLLVQQ